MSILSQNTERNATQELIDHILARTHHWTREQLYDAIGLPEAQVMLMRAGYSAPAKDHNKLEAFVEMLNTMAVEVAYNHENNFPHFPYHDRDHEKGV